MAQNLSFRLYSEGTGFFRSDQNNTSEGERQGLQGRQETMEGGKMPIEFFLLHFLGALGVLGVHRSSIWLGRRQRWAYS